MYATGIKEPPERREDGNSKDIALIDKVDLV